MKIYIANSNECLLSARGDQFGFEERFRKTIEGSQFYQLVEEPKRADMIVINQCWRFRDWRHLKAIESCQFINKYSSKLVIINHNDTAVTFLPGLYVSLTPGNYWKGWVEPCGYKGEYPISKAVDDEFRGTQPRWLFSFRGVDFSHPIRKRLAKLFSKKSDKYSYSVVNIKAGAHTENDRSVFLTELLSSNFALAPRGWSPSTYRMFEAMQYGRCPVIISDDWQPIAGINWNKCSIRIAEQDIEKIVDILTERVSGAESLGIEAQRVWKDNFSNGVREEKMLRALVNLHRNCPRPRDMESLKKLWHSHEFHVAHEWTLIKKIKQLLQIKYRLRQFLSKITT